MTRITLAAAFILAGISAALATPSIPNREPGIEQAQTWVAMIVPCGTDEECEVESSQCSVGCNVTPSCTEEEPMFACLIFSAPFLILGAAFTLGHVIVYRRLP